MHGTGGLSMVTSETRVTMPAEERTALLHEVLTDARRGAEQMPHPSERKRVLAIIGKAEAIAAAETSQ